ncbi:GtrA family protein [Ornithinimicrobium cavernae]|uniref:GtrA family protein n=1 Tax=Ornithinimicrobium cavernae TaxID=2666047 RepID=UPI001F31AFEE|nr:GtrA family protein [Ornithinimicrobium cavernae]
MSDVVPGRPVSPLPALRTTARTRAPRRTAAEWFLRGRDAAHAALPARLGHWLPPTAIGYGALSAFTYAVDLALLSLLFDVIAVPYPVAVTTGYAVAFTLSFVLNRWLNFRSHGSVSRQSGRFVVSTVANYLLFILALATTLEWLGVNYLLARLLAGACEAAFMYTMMRFYIFRRTGERLSRGRAW